jgi:hypothetical protein
MPPSEVFRNGKRILVILAPLWLVLHLRPDSLCLNFLSEDRVEVLKYVLRFSQVFVNRSANAINDHSCQFALQ